MEKTPGLAPTFDGLMRGQRGQTAAETMGVLLLISGIIFLLASSDTPAKIANRTKEIVCQIGGESNCGAAATDNGPNSRVTTDLDGPSLADHGPFLVLPFPGSSRSPAPTTRARPATSPASRTADRRRCQASDE